jgi:hypothetical protein
MAELVLKLTIPLEAPNLAIGEVLPDHSSPLGNALATETVCFGVAKCCQRIASASDKTS